jgi:glycine cleavage system H protein
MEYELRSDLNYTDSHEWVKIAETKATIGITDYAQHQLGDIVFVELPSIGDVIEKGNVAGEIESVKAVGELKMPLSGEVIELNELLNEKPELLNESPYDNGWIIKLQISNNSEIEDLLSVENYKKVIENEEK